MLHKAAVGLVELLEELRALALIAGYGIDGSPDLNHCPAADFVRHVARAGYELRERRLALQGDPITVGAGLIHESGEVRESLLTQDRVDL